MLGYNEYLIMAQEFKNKTRKNIKETKISYPLGFLMDMKDTVSPILIKRIQIVNTLIAVIILSAATYLVWNNYLRPATGEELVSEMISAAGGMDTWTNIKHGQYDRTHKLFSETGEILRERVETVYFDKREGNVKFMVDHKTAEGLDVIIGKDQDGFWAFENELFVDARSKSDELGMMCDSKFCAPDCTMAMAFYRFSMPFKLADNGVIATNAGKKALGSDQAQVLDIGYDQKTGKDRWVFYTDLENKLIQKMEYHHHTDDGKDLPEEYFWSDYKEVDGLMISHKWTRYWSNGESLEEYTYSNFDFESELPRHFDERPSGLVAKN